MACRSLHRLACLCVRSSRIYGTVRRYSSIEPAVNLKDERVHVLLTRLTGMDFDKVFAPRKEPLEPPTYKLMTLEELEKAREECVERARELLRMPAVLEERAARGAVIKVDEKLDKAIKNRYIFTDTTQHMDDKDREIVVREVDGTLREADWSERDRMCQMFFPKLGRKMWLPKMLDAEQLPEVLDLGHHLTVLDVVCVQCAADSGDYIRVHRTVYEDIDQRGLYEMLWSTRYFGCLVWHLLTTNNIRGLLRHTVEKGRLSDAAGLVELYLIAYPSSEVTLSVQQLASQLDKSSDIASLQAFCDYNGLEDVSRKVIELIEINREENTEHDTLISHQKSLS